MIRASHEFCDVPVYDIKAIMFSISIGDFRMICHVGAMPPALAEHCTHARLVEEFDRDSKEGACCLVAVARGVEWPTLVVTQRCKLPEPFGPQALLVLETSTLFLAVGERLLAYCLDGPARLWEDVTNGGAWTWTRHGAFVLLSAELELAAWNLHGEKLWAAYVEPPWQYHIVNGLVNLYVMGKCLSFPIDVGPAQQKQ